MVARGNLGVEIPIERIAVVQKQITGLVNRFGKPVITATQVLESMVTFRRPTRAEATHVANDTPGGTDCVMLSAESAMGRYPVESVAMLASIATHVESERSMPPFVRTLDGFHSSWQMHAVDLIAASVYHTIKDSSLEAASGQRCVRARPGTHDHGIDRTHDACAGVSLRPPALRRRRHCRVSEIILSRVRQQAEETAHSPLSQDRHGDSETRLSAPVD
jgi:pyruvate kinase